MYERFTDRTKKVMQLANQEAQRLNHEYIGTEHVLLAFVRLGEGTGISVLRDLGVKTWEIRSEIGKIITSGSDIVTLAKLPQTQRAKKVIEYAIEESQNLRHNYVGTEHLLLGLLRENEGVAAQVLMKLGVQLENARKKILELLGGATAGVTRESLHGSDETVRGGEGNPYMDLENHLARLGERMTVIERKLEHVLQWIKQQGDLSE